MKNNRNLPIVYCFLPNKQQKTYLKLFNKIKYKGISVTPVYIFFDFEIILISLMPLKHTIFVLNELKSKSPESTKPIYEYFEKRLVILSIRGPKLD